MKSTKKHSTIQLEPAIRALAQIKTEALLFLLSRKILYIIAYIQILTASVFAVSSNYSTEIADRPAPAERKIHNINQPQDLSSSSALIAAAAQNGSNFIWSISIKLLQSISSLSLSFGQDDGNVQHSSS